MPAAPSFEFHSIGFPRSSVQAAREVKRFFGAGGTREDLVRQINSACLKVSGLFQAFGDPEALPLIEVFEDYSQFTAPILLAAAREGRMELLERYLQGGADTEATNEWGTALVTAVEHKVAARSQAMVRRLVEAGADVNTPHFATGCTPLMHAAGFADLEIVKLLLRAGADVRATCAAGETALHKAMRPIFSNGVAGRPDGDRVAVAKLLLDAGAGVDVRNFHRFTPLLALASQGPKESAALVRLLLDAGADLEARNREGMTPLLVAVQSNAHAAITPLIDAGADTGATTKLGAGISRLGDAETKRLMKSIATARRVESAMGHEPADAEIPRRSAGLSATL